jgi:uncharacterized protein YukE
MGQPTYAGNFHGIRDTASTIVALGGQIGDRVYASENFANNQMENWTDDARTQYNTVKQQWNTAIGEMNRILAEQAGPSLNKMVDNMELTEQQNQRGWAQ